MNKSSIALALSCLIISTSNGFAAECALADRFTDENLIRIVKSEGYGAVEKLNDGMIRIKVDGAGLVLFNKEDGDLQLYYSIGGADVSTDDMNEWNRTKRLSRAYLDADKDPTLESDLLANAGLTEKQVTEFLNVFKLSVGGFRAFVINKNSK